MGHLILKRNLLLVLVIMATLHSYTSAVWSTGFLGSLSGGSKRCSGNSQCQQDECCVTLNPPRGRRKRDTTGECQSMGTFGDSCYVMHPKLEDVNVKCPCESGLVCVGSGVFEVPMGEIGTCN